MTVTFACGHAVGIARTVEEPPICPCGEHRITRVDVPKPRITGIGASPLKKG